MLFQFTALAQDTIRLLRFLPYSTPDNLFVTFEHQSRYFERDVHYTAISYHSEAASDDRKSITLNGRAFLIPLTLFNILTNILQHHRSSEDERFWADAICINSRDLDEKNNQVRLMSRIYSSADRVLCWLGLEDKPSASAFARIQNRLTTCPFPTTEECVSFMMTSEMERFRWEFSHPGKYHFEAADEPEVEAVTPIFYNDYFRQTQVQPQALHALNASIICGIHRWDYNTLHHYLIASNLYCRPDFAWAFNLISTHSVVSAHSFQS